MFKQIPGNHNFTISLNGEIRTLNGNISDLPINDGKVVIELYGKYRCVDLKWLSLFAFYETELPMDFTNRIFDIEFTDINPNVCNSPTGKVMVFSKPFYIDKKFRIIPGFVQYCVDRSGTVKEILSGRTLRISNSNQYPKVYIYHPEVSSLRSVSVHRLVALTWLKNHSFLDKPIVNHINGNKKDFRSINLEWCSYQENIVHAVKNGLRNDNRRFKVKDHLIGVITVYDSFRQVCIALGLQRERKYRSVFYKRKVKIINSRYEIKTLDDQSPWLDNLESVHKRGMYQIDVTFPDGTNKTFHDTRDLLRELKLWNVGSGLTSLIEKAKKLYPGIVFKIHNNYEIKPVQALDITNGKVIEADSIRDLSRKLEINFSTIHNVIINEYNRVVNGYIFRFKSELPWSKDFKTYVSAAKKIKAVNKVTQEVVILESLRKATRYLHVDRSCIKRCLESGDNINNWVFEEVG